MPKINFTPVEKKVDDFETRYVALFFNAANDDVRTDVMDEMPEDAELHAAVEEGEVALGVLEITPDEAE